MNACEPPVGGERACEHRLELDEERVHARLDDRVEERLLVGEVAVERPLGDTRLAPDRLHRQAGDPVAAEEAHDRVDDRVALRLLPRRRRPLGDRRAALSGRRLPGRCLTGTSHN